MSSKRLVDRAFKDPTLLDLLMTVPEDQQLLLNSKKSKYNELASRRTGGTLDGLCLPPDVLRNVIFFQLKKFDVEPPRSLQVTPDPELIAADTTVADNSTLDATDNKVESSAGTPIPWSDSEHGDSPVQKKKKTPTLTPAPAKPPVPYFTQPISSVPSSPLSIVPVRPLNSTPLASSNHNDGVDNENTRLNSTDAPPTDSQIIPQTSPTDSPELETPRIAKPSSGTSSAYIEEIHMPTDGISRFQSSVSLTSDGQLANEMAWPPCAQPPVTQETDLSLLQEGPEDIPDSPETSSNKRRRHINPLSYSQLVLDPPQPAITKLFYLPKNGPPPGAEIQTQTRMTIGSLSQSQLESQIRIQEPIQSPTRSHSKIKSPVLSQDQLSPISSHSQHESRNYSQTHSEYHCQTRSQSRVSQIQQDTRRNSQSDFLRDISGSVTAAADQPITLQNPLLSPPHAPAPASASRITIQRGLEAPSSPESSPSNNKENQVPPPPMQPLSQQQQQKQRQHSLIVPQFPGFAKQRSLSPAASSALSLSRKRKSATPAAKDSDLEFASLRDSDRGTTPVTFEDLPERRRTKRQETALGSVDRVRESSLPLRKSSVGDRQIQQVREQESQIMLPERTCAMARSTTVDTPSQYGPDINMSPYEWFCHKYPSYNGSEDMFRNGLVYLRHLCRNNQFPEYLYDDMMRAFSHEYKHYIMTSGVTITAVNYYFANVQKPQFTSMVITKDTLDKFYLLSGGTDATSSRPIGYNAPAIPPVVTSAPQNKTLSAPQDLTVPDAKRRRTIGPSPVHVVATSTPTAKRSVSISSINRKPHSISHALSRPTFDVSQPPRVINPDISYDESITFNGDLAGDPSIYEASPESGERLQHRSLKRRESPREVVRKRINEGELKDRAREREREKVEKEKDMEREVKKKTKSKRHPLRWSEVDEDSLMA